MNKRLVFISLFIIILLSGVFIRLYYADSFDYKDSKGKYISSNPDGLYWLKEGVKLEKWAEVNPMKNKYFSLVIFGICISIGLLILNIKKPDIVISCVFMFFMLFSKVLYTRSSIGFYDHDLLGLGVILFIILFHYLGMPFSILNPIIVYSLLFLWDGLLPIACLLVLIIFIEYIFKDKSIRINILKYLIYILMGYFVIKSRTNPRLYITETVFVIGLVIIMLPFIVTGVYISNKKGLWLWQGILTFSTIILLHSGRMNIIAYPLIFLAICMCLKEVKKKNLIVISLVFVFMITQLCNYNQLDRFGTSEADKGIYWLEENTNKSDIMLSWWDFGYYIKYLSNRESKFTGTEKKGGLGELSRFYCNGKLPSYNFDYFVHFIYKTDIIPTILLFNGAKCNQEAYIYSISSDKRFKLVYSNIDIEIYKKVRK